MILNKCSRPMCDFVTSETYNYCPMCGGVLFVFVDGESVGSTADIMSRGALCDMADQCKSIGLYSAECDELKLRHQCVQVLAGYLESLELEFRMLRLAFAEAGLRVVPRTPDGLSAQQVREL